MKKGSSISSYFPEKTTTKDLISFAILAAEFLHPSGSIDQFLLAGEERMTFGTDFHFNLRKSGGTGDKRIPASTDYTSLFIFRMYSLLHTLHLYYQSGKYYNTGILRCQKELPAFAQAKMQS
jgi:hypothetical protein